MFKKNTKNTEVCNKNTANTELFTNIDDNQAAIVSGGFQTFDPVLGFKSPIQIPMETGFMIPNLDPAKPKDETKPTTSRIQLLSLRTI